MRIGDLRHRVSLQYPTETTDAMGAVATTWTTDATISAAIWPVSANEQVRQGQQAMLGTYRIRIRYHRTIDETWRIKHGSDYYSIHGIINPNLKNELLDLICREAQVE